MDHALPAVPSHPLTDDVLAAWRTGSHPVLRAAAEVLPACLTVADRLTAYRAARDAHAATDGGSPALSLPGLIGRAVRDLREQRERFPRAVADAVHRGCGIAIESWTYDKSSSIVPVPDRGRALFVHPDHDFHYAHVNPCVPFHPQVPELMRSALVALHADGWDCELDDMVACITVQPRITAPQLAALRTGARV